MTLLPAFHVYAHPGLHAPALSQPFTSFAVQIAGSKAALNQARDLDMSCPGCDVLRQTLADVLHTACGCLEAGAQPCRKGWSGAKGFVDEDAAEMARREQRQRL